MRKKALQWPLHNIHDPLPLPLEQPQRLLDPPGNESKIGLTRLVAMTMMMKMKMKMKMKMTMMRKLGMMMKMRRRRMRIKLKEMIVTTSNDLGNHRQS